MTIPNEFDPIGLGFESGPASDETIFKINVPANVTQKYTIQINGTDLSPKKIDWGDGTIQEYTSRYVNGNHTYQYTDGDVYLIIKGHIESISFNENLGNKYGQFVQAGEGVSGITWGLCRSINTTSIPDVDFNDVKNLHGFFEYSKLTTAENWKVPQGTTRVVKLFEGTPITIVNNVDFGQNQLEFTRVFSSCTRLERITDSVIFPKFVAANYLFNGCNNLKSIDTPMDFSLCQRYWHGQYFQFLLQVSYEH